MMTEIQKIFLRLVRLGIGHTDTTEITEKVDWEAVLALAERQGLSAVVADGIDWLKVHGEGSTAILPPKPVILQLIGSVLQNYEYRHNLYRGGNMRAGGLLQQSRVQDDGAEGFCLCAGLAQAGASAERGY